MRRQRSGDAGKRSAILPLVILLGALLASVPAGCSAVRLWRRLPARHVARLESREVEAAFERVNRGMSPEAREAFALRQASGALTDAFTGAIEREELQPALAAAIRVLTRSQVGRLQLAVARMWRLEEAGEPIEGWWPALRDFLEGLQGADLEHGQAALTEHWARAYQATGLGPGTARTLAEDLVGHPHGPFLEFLVPRLREVVAERRRAGDEAAAKTVRQVLYSLLRRWVLEPGPAGLRLLAADLLSKSLEEDGAGEATEAPAIAEGLRQWRAAYHEAARHHPIATLAPIRKPAFAPEAHERLLTRVGLVTWHGSAALVAAAVAILFGWSWRRDRGVAAGVPRLAVVGIGVALLVLIGGLLWVHLRQDSLREDLRSDFSGLRYWWRHPFVAGGLTLACMLLGGLLQRPQPGGRSQFLARVGAVAAGAWLTLAVMVWGGAWAGELARRDYERATLAASEDPMAAFLGPEAETLLAELRRWEP